MVEEEGERCTCGNSGAWKPSSPCPGSFAVSSSGSGKGLFHPPEPWLNGGGGLTLEAIHQPRRR